MQSPPPHTSVPEDIFFFRVSMATASVMVSRMPPSSHVAITAYGRRHRSSFSACGRHMREREERERGRTETRTQHTRAPTPRESLIIRLAQHITTCSFLAALYALACGQRVLPPRQTRPRQKKRLTWKIPETCWRRRKRLSNE
jgi:hypothetical protein